MLKADKKYVVNIDFPTFKDEGGHKIHLNPYFEGSVLREKILRHYDPQKDKIPRDGGAIYLSKVEAAECLGGSRRLEWQWKSAYPFRTCKLCEKLSEWNI